jgi:hypothetical protein
MKKTYHISREQLIEWGPVLGLMLLALALRVWGLGRESGWVDDLFGLVRLRDASFSDYYRQVISYDPSGPLMPLFQYFLGPDHFRSQIMSVLCGVATLPVVYLLTQNLYGRPSAYAAILLLALNMSHIYYSQEARAYAMTGLFTSLSAYTLLRALVSQKPKWWIFHTVSLVCVAISHILAAVVMGGFACFVIFTRRMQPRRILVSLSILAFVMVLGLMVLLTRSKAPFQEATTLMNPIALQGGEDETWRTGLQITAWMEPVTLYDILRVFMFFSGAVSSMFPRLEHLQSDLTMGVLLTIYVSVLVGFATYRLLRNWRDKEQDNRSLPAWWFWGTVGAVYVATLVIRPCFLYRYMFHAIIPVTLLVVYSITRIPCKPLRFGAWLLLAVLSSYQLWIRADIPLRWDWRACAAAIESKGKSQDIVAVAPGYHRDSFVYNSNISPNQILKCDSIDYFRSKVLPLTAYGKGVWIVVWPQYVYGKVRQRFLNDIRAELKVSGRKYDETIIPGWQPLFLFHIPAR